MKKITLTLLSLVAAFSVQAAQTVTHSITGNWGQTNLTAGINSYYGTNLLAIPVQLYSLSVTAGTADTKLKLFDSADAYVLQTDIYTSNYRYNTNLSRIFTTPGGILTTNWYSNVVYTTTGISITNVQGHRALYSGTVSSNTISTVYFDPPIVAHLGVTLTNIAQPISVTISYDPLY